MNKSEVINLLDGGMTVRIPAWELVGMVDHFWDTGNPNEEPEYGFEDLMDQKTAELGQEFIDSVMRVGVKSPCDVNTTNDRLEFEDGHHRLAIALSLDLDIPISSTSLERDDWHGKLWAES